MITELRQKLKDATTKFYSLKTKKAKERQRDVIRAISLDLHDALMNGIQPFLGVRHEGVIVSGGVDCLARTEFGLVPVYAVNDKQSKSWYESTCCVSYKVGDKITFEIKHPRVENDRLNWFAAEVEGGTFDQNKYKELCKRDNLAFFQRPNGTTSGLFK